MTISGFTFMKNTSKLFYPLKESIESILPIVDEFVVLLGDCDADDETLEILQTMECDKIKIYHSIWDRETYPNAGIYAQQTDEAMKYCSGDWLFYLQSDEVVHERYLDTIKSACEHYKEDKRIEGLLFQYHHFWGDFDHYHKSHGWYKREIRIVKNGIKDLHSFRDAQSFRVMPNFNGVDYYGEEGSRKLNVALLDAYINHYGWVRPPRIMKMKSHTGEMLEGYYDYGAMRDVALFEDSHPAVMDEWMERFDWADELYEEPHEGSVVHKHQRWRVKIATFLEGLLYNHKDEIGGFKNYNIIERYR
jgi:glycosyltransferase involved in cell wall biosynthesis